LYPCLLKSLCHQAFDGLPLSIFLPNPRFTFSCINLIGFITPAFLFLTDFTADPTIFSPLYIYTGKTNHLPETEQLLIKGCIAGDRAFQTKLYHLFAPKMLGVCLRYARNREEAEEILQEGFLRVFIYIHTFKGNGSFEGWIRKIMVNAALLRYRNKSQLQPVIRLDNSNHDAAGETDIASNMDAKELLTLVQTLPAGYRIVFNLYVFEGYKHREIAEAVGISEGTSKSNLSDARAFLQKALQVKKKLVHYK
jgi:RNA polymerase sigma factor (sigma-70 family)